MKAVAFSHPGPIESADSLVDIELPRPSPGPGDLLVNVYAVSVNPVDTKVRGAKHRASAAASASAGQAIAGPRVIGWDAAGVVVEKGASAAGFEVGDEVFYAGALERPGSNAEFQAVDARLVGKKPKSIDFAQAAALPLTSMTAWELMFDRMNIAMGESGASILVSGAAGGVGSILIQLARQLTGLTIIATASRPETVRWVKEMGAQHVIDHSQPMAAQIADLTAPPVKYVMSLTQTGANFPQFFDLIAPQGRIGVIDDPPSLEINSLKRKAVSVHLEFMFARSMWQTPDIAEQGKILDRVSQLVDQGLLRTTQSENITPINAANLKRVHAQLESGKTIGKITLSGF